MKPNVDLTVDRKFNNTEEVVSNDLSVRLRRKILASTSNIKYPWNMNVVKIVPFFGGNKSMILTGNKEERRRKQIDLDFSKIIKCECCGVRLNNKPWRKGSFRFCIDCDRNLNRESDSLWKVQMERFRPLRNMSGFEDSDEEISLAELVLKGE